MTAASAGRPLLEVRDLTVRFGPLTAVNAVSFSVGRGETVGIVGESGSGKTALAHAVMRLHDTPPATYPSGEVIFDGHDLLRLDERDMRAVRGADIAMIFQDPMASLNPVFTIGDQVAEAVLTHGRDGKAGARRRTIDALAETGLPDPESLLDKYPHELSGGMQQRVMIAMALVMRPTLLIADEPTTALDVTIQAQVLTLLDDLRRRHDMTVLFITHDLGALARLADRVLVMYAGHAVELGAAEAVYRAPRMPYTVDLLAATPRPGDRAQPLRPIPGAMPDLINPPRGCPFAPRCRSAREICHLTKPVLEEKVDGHWARCHLQPNEFVEAVSPAGIPV